jgi:repressor of nif and glnA expression
MTSQGVRNRLDRIDEKGLVSRKKIGARAIGRWAEVAPELDTDRVDEVDERKESDEWSEL